MSEYIGNRYRIVKLIGRGGMADVYLAYDVILKREVAVKILKSDMADDDTALERFKREAGAVTQLSHPNIVDVYDVGDDKDRHYIVMEYIKGYTLKQLIKKRGPIPYKEAVWMMKQLAGALMEAHRNNVIHRDVKSQNVLIKDDGTIKLSDFGIALANGAMQITKKDSVLGSVHYLAPELSRGKQASMQSDIYSLGIVFYELLTGDVPFKADNPVQ
ncbi:MAG: serine/threonine protein kinase, partial [Erysipelotrichaceae bacterium]|nr:serine/threonine protein kinase [Erysipelotrichaceae bacterium]